MKYKPKPRFASGFLLRGGNDGVARLIGGLFPQPELRSANQTALLDEFLGTGFALLATPQTPASLFERLPVELWAPLRIQRVAVRLAADATPATPDVVILRDPSGAFANSMKDVPPGLFLIRPDHYVATFLRAEQMEHDLRAVNELMDRTWG
jgi:3-(3-hydroxy-phenyl)propionate hydroxylase